MNLSRKTANAKERALPGSYVYCVVAAPRAPSLARVPRGPAGLAHTRLVEVDGHSGAHRLWMVVADAPADRFGEDEINRNVSNVDWVSRIAMAHEAVVAAFIRADAVLPMKLFTIFANDARAAAHLGSERAQIERVLARVSKRDEWGVRLVLEAGKARGVKAGRRQPTGTSYLARKKEQREARAELVEQSREVAAELYDRLAAIGSDARRRPASELPASGGPLLLDAAFLVPRSRTTHFRSTIARRAKALRPRGYRVSLTGPWPPYTFMRES